MPFAEDGGQVSETMRKYFADLCGEDVTKGSGAVKSPLAELFGESKVVSLSPQMEREILREQLLREPIRDQT